MENRTSKSQLDRSSPENHKAESMAGIRMVSGAVLHFLRILIEINRDAYSSRAFHVLWG